MVNKPTSLLIVILALLALIQTGQAATLAQNTALDYVTPMKVYLTPTDCWNTGSGGCGYIHRADSGYNGRSSAYAYTRIGKMITVDSTWDYVEAIEITYAVTNNTYPMVVTLSSATTSDPDTATTSLINTWYLYKNCDQNNTGCAAKAQLNLDYDEDVTNDMGEIIIPYLFIEILNPISGSIGVMPRIGVTRTISGIPAFATNTYYLSNWNNLGDYDFAGNMIYPAYTDYYGYSYPANPTDTRLFMNDMYFKMYGQFRFPTTPDPTPSATSTQPITTSTIPEGTPPAPGEGEGELMIPDFGNGTIICPDCAGNETEQRGEGIDGDTGIGGTMKGLGYCKSGTCTTQDFIDFLYDFSNAIFILSIMFIMVKMFRYKKTKRYGRRA